MEPLVSVLIPVYNSALFLEECIDSAINQTYGNYEIITVDDGSTDDSGRILEKYSDDIKVVYQENQGLASAVNNGISRCHGKYIKWMSPDDVMYPYCLEELVSHSGSGRIVYSDWDIIDEQSRVLRSFCESDYNSLEPFDFAVRLLDGQQINVNTTLIPAPLFAKCKIRKLDDPVAIDYDFFLNAALNHSVSFFLVKKPLIKYRVHTKQLSHKNITKTLSFLDEIKQEYLQGMDSHTREMYVAAMNQYRKGKPLGKQAMDAGLSILSKLPSELSDSLLVYYLNHIRTKR